MPDLARIDVGEGSAALAAALEEDGAVIVENALTAEQLDGLNADLDEVVRKTAPGLRHPTEEFFVEFYGPKTIRLDGLPAKSRTFVDLMEEPWIHEVADHFLLPSCQHYLLNTGQLIQIGPGETAQLIHRDEDAWPDMPVERPQLEVECMFALTDFTEENGATQVVPGSHKWDKEREPEAHEIGRAVMPAGSALLYLGSTLHGGGTNTTSDVWRRGMFFGYVVGWLRTEENFYLTVPFEMVKDMPERVQILLGYKAHRGIGVVDVGDPIALLR